MPVEAEMEGTVVMAEVEAAVAVGTPSAFSPNLLRRGTKPKTPLLRALEELEEEVPEVYHWEFPVRTEWWGKFYWLFSCRDGPTKETF